MNAQAPSGQVEPPVALEHALLSSARVVISAIAPSVDEGRFAVKRAAGDTLVVEADVFADGHEQLAASVLYRKESEWKWHRAAMEPVVNDRWRARVLLDSEGVWRFRVEAWIDVYGGFAEGTAKKREAGLPLELESIEGRELIAAARAHASAHLREALGAVLDGWDALSDTCRIDLLLAAETRLAMRAADDRPFRTRSYEQVVQVERKRAAFASWYELFPRSYAREPGRHGTFRDVIAELPRIKAMGFDVLYFPPIHPIGATNRKGRNNALISATSDPGSTYAIGSAAGGHDAIHPELGTPEDFRALVAAAAAHGMEIALDFAVQMSPDHPWLKSHPDWFRKRPDGSIRYAENPPKKYEDIVNPDFYVDSRLWIALRDVVRHWIAQGVRTFRVDNPHTKPLPFWEWLIADIRAENPDVIFLAEAFTRPKLMYRLAKVGFSESYTYFTWRNTKQELTDYLTELSAPPVSDFFRPHFFVNTPDINPYFLQQSGRAGFLIRAALAATLSGLWGMYSGFELCEAEALPGREEYLHSEKYELKHRNFAAPGNISEEIARLNAVRRQEPHLQSHLGVTFYNAFNDNILYFAKMAEGRDDRVLVAINLDPHSVQSADFEVPLWEWGLPDHETVDVEDLLRGDTFTWTGKIQRLQLAPAAPYAIWRVRPQAGVRR